MFAFKRPGDLGMDTRCLPAKVAGPTSALKVYPVRGVPSVAAVPMCQQEEWARAFEKALCYAQVQTFLFSCDVHRCWGLAVTLINDGPGTAFRMPSFARQPVASAMADLTRH